MLSQDNAEKLKMNGIYSCKCDPELLPKYCRGNPTWCKNWTFRPKIYDGKYFMFDTYYGWDDHPIELTDELFDRFTFLFELNDVRIINDISRWMEYPDDQRWCAKIDSGDAKYFVKSGTKKVKERVIKRIQNEINELKARIASKEKDLELVVNDEIDTRYV